MNETIKRSLDNVLRLEAQLVLHCLYNSEIKMLTAYYTNIGKIPTEVFESLISNGYLTYNGTDVPAKYTLDNIKLTDKFEKEVLKIKPSTLTFEEAFKELRAVYPNKCPDGRRLHSDLDRCRKSYSLAVVKNGVLNGDAHAFILQCTNFFIAEQAKIGKLNFISALPAYLHQKGWKMVEDDVREITDKGGKIKEAGKVREYSENKTQSGGEDF